VRRSGSASGFLHAQNSQGTILGHVQDSSGAAIPGAKVTATHVNTNIRTISPPRLEGTSFWWT